MERIANSYKNGRTISEPVRRGKRAAEIAIKENGTKACGTKWKLTAVRDLLTQHLLLMKVKMIAARRR